VFKERSFALGIAAPALVLVGLFATAASAAPLIRQFDCQFRDAPWGALELCGSGRISHFGSVTSTVVLRPTAVGPFAGCQTYTGARTLTFAKEKGKLRLAVRGSACFPPRSPARAWGTFTIVTGSGIFSNAKGQGVIWGTPLQLRYFGLLSSPNRSHHRVSRIGREPNPARTTSGRSLTWAGAPE
jgi:hypothetical protein